MATSRTTPSQFEIMMDFMERHGDIGKSTEAHKSHKRLENLRKWIELTELLNSSSEDSVKPVEKWRKVWGDFKNNTKKKMLRIKKFGKGPPMSDIEKRVIKFMGYNIEPMRSASMDNNCVIIKSEEDETLRKSESPTHRYFYLVDENSKTLDSASSYAPSVSSPQPTPPAKRRKSNNYDGNNEGKRNQFNDNENMKDLRSKFLEFEREKDRRSHEAEMARLKQNDRLISIVGRIVNVLETLTPSFQRYLDKNINNGE